ncbi:ParB/RepB/Spo0J family partition protein [Oceanobacillus senegalensis]|uniref:ParB/RepB/Spo0J family partition protein n=1 Tax=Oceanobacillus senegalensis TaxID=1936063 RepID=UPI000A30575E|nr:ParB/RepB/Spo0J family partition protein [Oceanobacillus senegalensis]
MTLHFVFLSDIVLEKSYRKVNFDSKLALDIAKHGLSVPMIVEKQNGKYILVDGYRRYVALRHIEANSAWCIVEKETSKQNRIIKRLKNEFHNKKRTGYEMLGMITDLMEQNFDEKEIARNCNVTLRTVKKYIKASKVPKEWLSDGQVAGVGIQGLIDIYNLDQLKGDNKEYLKNLYIDKKITGEQIKEIKRSITNAPFNELTTISQKKTLDDMVHSIKDNNSISFKDIIYENSLKEKHNDKSHGYIFNLIIKSLDHSLSLLSKNFTTHLSIEQKNAIYEKAVQIIEILGMPIKWSEFPNTTNRQDRDDNDFLQQ